MSLKTLFAPRDMTEGAPWQRITEFAVPMLLGNIAQQLYNTADSIIVGMYVGDNALSAVGSASPILNMLLALFVGVATGAGIVISQSYGAKDREALSTAIGNCISLAVIATIIIMIVGPMLTMPMLEMLGTPTSIIYWCADYLNIFFYGILGFFMYNMLSGVLRGLGDSLSALGFLLIAAALNIVLDLVFVAKFNMGVPGVALATVMAQAISAVLCFIKLMKMHDLFDLNKDTIKLNKKVAMRVIRLGVPSGITQAIMAIAQMTVQTLTNSMGEMVIACMVIIMRVDGFAMMPNFTFGQAMGVYTGQNVGAGKHDRVYLGCKQGLMMAVGTSTVLTALVLIFGRTLFGFFTKTPHLINMASEMMMLMAVGYICMSVTQVLGGVMRGSGDTVTPMWISIFTTIIIRVPAAYIIAHLTANSRWPNGQPWALSGSLLIAWTLGMVAQILAYKFGPWRKKMHMGLES
ncbi:MAG: MATE family efflux transporter [Oscillospiraceae bacterium]|nr:MATE family efflux transporter [Oscillospiraceae bacterium]